MNTPNTNDLPPSETTSTSEQIATQSEIVVPTAPTNEDVAKAGLRALSMLQELSQTVSIELANGSKLKNIDQSLRAAVTSFENKDFTKVIAHIQRCQEEGTKKGISLLASTHAIFKFAIAEAEFQLGHMQSAYNIQNINVLGLKERLAEYAEAIRDAANKIVLSIDDKEEFTDFYIIEKKALLDRALDLYATIKDEAPPKAKFLALKFKWFSIKGAAIEKFVELQEMRSKVQDEKKYNQELKSAIDQHVMYVAVMSEADQQTFVAIKQLKADSDDKVTLLISSENRAKLDQLHAATVAYLKQGNLPEALDSMRAESTTANLIITSELRDEESAENYAQSIMNLSEQVKLYKQRRTIGSTENAKLIVDKAFKVNGAFSQALSLKDYNRACTDVREHLAANWYKFDRNDFDYSATLETISKKLSDQIEWGCCGGPALFFTRSNSYILDWSGVKMVLDHNVDYFDPKPALDNVVRDAVFAEERHTLKG